MNRHANFMRDTGLVIVTTGTAVIFIGGDGEVVRHASQHPEAWSRLLQRLAHPVSGDEASEIAETVPDLDTALWDRLVDGGFFLESADRDALVKVRDSIFYDNRAYHLVPGETALGHLVFACTGSIVAGLMEQTILSLSYSRFQEKLDVVVSEAAQTFVTRDLLEAYGIRTWGDTFERRDGINVPHVQLGSSADCILVMPASANCLHRLAASACTDLLSLMVTASHAPVVLAPVMNQAMWNNPGVQRNIRTLREDGMYVIEPTLIFAASDFAAQGVPGYGGHGTMWAGPLSVMRTLRAVLAERASQ